MPFSSATFSADRVALKLGDRTERVALKLGNIKGIKLGETTEDGRITLKVEEECLAACVGAPMMVVDGHYHEHLTVEKVDAILDGLE